MKYRRSRFLFFCIFLMALSCAAQDSPASRVVDLTANDGTNLKGSYFSAAKAGPGVLLLHQCNRQRKVWDGVARQLASAGINVLTLDLRGFGESGGSSPSELTPQQAATQARNWPSDIDVAFQYLKSQAGVSPDFIGVGGASCSVNNSVQTAIRHPEIKSLVLLSGGTDLKGREYLRKTSAPVFFAVADDDEFPPTLELIEWLYVLTRNPGKKLVHYKTGGHGADMFPVHPELPETIVDWYVTTLIKTPGKAPASKQAAAVSPEAKVLDMMDQPDGTAKVAQMLKNA